MGVVFAQAVAHDAGALAVGLVGRVAQFQHGVEDAPLHGLEAVLDPGQGALEDDVLRVGDHAVVHDLLHGFLGLIFTSLIWISQNPAAIGFKLYFLLSKKTFL